MKYAEPRFLICSDTALCVEFGDEISEELAGLVRAFGALLAASGIPGVYETVPTYRSVLIHYEPGVLTYAQLVQRLRLLCRQLDTVTIEKKPPIRVPVLYGGEWGPDLPFVAEHSGLTEEEEVVRLHCEPVYLIYMLGFTPGFSYLGGMDERIATPRLKSPRVRIPAGSVGIAGSQTGIYPIDSPGGWQLIGQTPFVLYDPNRQDPILFEAGEYIQFYPIGEREFYRIKDEQTGGERYD